MNELVGQTSLFSATAGKLMTLDEMREHEWTVSWSGGKDSTATILLMREHGVPIERVVYVRMMFDDTLPATLPIMTDFVDNATERFRTQGIRVDIIPSIRSAWSLAVTPIGPRSKSPEFIGKIPGVGRFNHKFCGFTRIKIDTINQNLKKGTHQMIGIAADEPRRMATMGGTRQSILWELGATEDDCLRICKEEDMLSPLYGSGIKRDGCFFCGNARADERELIKTEYPELYQRILDMIKLTDPEIFKTAWLNNWFKDYIAEQDTTQTTLF